MKVNNCVSVKLEKSFYQQHRKLSQKKKNKSIVNFKIFVSARFNIIRTEVSKRRALIEKASSSLPPEP